MRFLSNLAKASIGLTLLLGTLSLASNVRAELPRDETPPFPGDLSGAGLIAYASTSEDPGFQESLLGEEVLNAVRGYLRELRSQGAPSGVGRLSVPIPAPTNVRANNPAGDIVGETQAEVAVAVHGDTVVVGWNDSRGFAPGNTVSGFGYSTDGGVTFTDGGSVPLAAAGDQAFGDPGVDTDERGNWYYNQIYTRGTTQQNIAVHHGRFNGAGQLVWDSPVQASIGTGATGFLDKCLIACDRLTGNVYVAYTRFTANPRIEIVRSTTLGSSWDPPVVLDAGTTPTASKQAARPFCGPNGEVYVVWEKGANFIFCPGAGGNLSNTSGVMGFTRSLDFGVTYDPVSVIGTIDHSWTWSGPGDLRERGNEFPDIGVDRSGGPHHGSIYVTWHESAPWTSNLSAGPVSAELNDAANNNPTNPELFAVGDDATGSISSLADLDYWQFSATEGESFLLNCDPQGFVCGVSGTSRGMRMRLFATQSPYPVPTAFPDTLLAASALGTFVQRIVWTAPKTGTYLVRLQRSSGAVPFTYTLRVRPLTFDAPSPARDARDVVVVRSSDQGLTWSSEMLVNDDPVGLENRRPFICVDGLGHVHTFWHDSRVPGFGSNAALTSIFGTTSRDGGLSWTPNYCVTDELSFFSFNTIAVPNLGDYNQAAAWIGDVHAAWSDQRISTGDVRNPVPPPTYTAGFGPEAYTTVVRFEHAVACPPDTVICTLAPTVTRQYTVTNTGTVPDRYDWTLADTEGWSGGTDSGSTGEVAPGGSATVSIALSVPADCGYPSSNTLTFTATPVGAPLAGIACSSAVACPVLIAFDMDPNTFNLGSLGHWVTGRLEPSAPFTADQIDVASVLLNGVVPVDPGAPVTLGDDDENGVQDLLIKFDRDAVAAALDPGDPVQVVVTGNLDGQCFVGTDEIRVIGVPVNSPAGGSVVTASLRTPVTWDTPVGVIVQSVAILSSLDGGMHWTLDAENLPNTGTYSWKAPSAYTEQGRVAVVLVESEAPGSGGSNKTVRGVMGLSGLFTIQVVTGIGPEIRGQLALHGVRPNPASRQMHVSFSLKDDRPASLGLYDVAGRQIERREVGILGAGDHESTFQAAEELPAGIYVIRLRQGDQTLTTRVTLLR